MDIIEKFKQSLAEYKITYEPLELDGKTYEFYFKERKLCLFIVNEEEYNEKTIAKDYFSKLSLKFKEIGIELMMMYRSHLLMKYDVIINRLMYKLKNENIIRIYARECEVYEPTYAESKLFLDAYHFQGSVMSKYRVGLKYKDELIAIAVFGVPRYNKAFDMEIGRFAIKFGYNIPGNFSKMFSYFIKKYQPKSVLTYHDLLFGTNSVYAKCGFIEMPNSPEGFYWYKNDKLYNRRGFWKSMLPKKLEKFDPMMSAHNNMRMHPNNYIKVWEMGQGKYYWGTPRKDKLETSEQDE